MITSSLISTSMEMVIPYLKAKFKVYKTDKMKEKDLAYRAKKKAKQNKNAARDEKNNNSAKSNSNSNSKDSVANFYEADMGLEAYNDLVKE